MKLNVLNHKQGAPRAPVLQHRLDRSIAVQWVGLVLIMGLGIAFRIYHLDTFMHWAWGDEMTYGIEAQRVIHGYYTGLLTYTWDTGPATYLYLLAWAHRLFGATLHTGRMVSVLAGTLSIPVVMLMARELKLSFAAIVVASGFLAVSHWHAYFSRMVLPATLTAFVLLVALYSLLVAFRLNRWWCSILAGLACGVAPYFFLANRVLPVILIVWFVYLLGFHRDWLRQSWPHAALLAVTVAVVMLPAALFWLHDPNWFLNPERRVGVFSNVSAWHVQNPGQSVAPWNIMLHQLWLAAGMFTIYGGPFIPFGGAYAPALDVLTGWALFPAIAYALYRWRHPLIALVLIWFFAIWFTGIVLSHDAPQLEHAVGLIPAIFILEALLFDAVVARVFRRHRGFQRKATAVAAFTVAVSAALNANVFFVQWGSTLAGSSGFAWQYYDAAQYVARQSTPHGTAVYAASYPDEFFRFLAPRAGEFTADPAHLQKASLYIIFPGAPVSPAAIAARIPGNRRKSIRDADGDLAFTAVLPPRP